MRGSMKLGVSAFMAAMLATGIASGQELKKVRIGISSTSFPAAGARIAKEMGLFEKRGIDAAITPMDNSGLATAGLISGSLEFTTTSPTEVFIAQSRGQQVVAVSSVYAGLAGVVVLSKAAVAKSGVSPTAPLNDRLKALDGLLIATPAATAQATFSLKSSADAAGATIRFTYMSQEAMVASFESGVIQGYMASSPYYTLPPLKGTGDVWISGPKREFPVKFASTNALTLNTMRSFAQANADTVKRVAGAFEDLSAAVKERPADVKAAVAKLFPNIDAKTIDFMFAEESEGFRPRPLTEDDMRHEIDMVKAAGSPVPGIDTIKVPDLILR